MKEIPEFNSEGEERQFWGTHDSIDYIEGAEQVKLDRNYPVSGATPMREYRFTYP